MLDVRDTNRLEQVPGLQRRRRRLSQDAIALWWYGAYRDSETDQRYPTLLDDIQDTCVPVGTGKVTYNADADHKLVGFYQFQTKEQPDYLGAIRIGGGRQTPALMTADSVWYSRSRCTSGRPSTAACCRVGVPRSARRRLSLGLGARGQVAARRAIEDIGNNFVSGGVWATDLRRHRPQANGALSYTKNDWAAATTSRSAAR